MGNKRYTSRKYDENDLIECACGCKEQLTRLDKEGRKREFISGHNGRKYNNPTQYKKEWNKRNRKQRYEYRKKYGHKRKGKLLLLKGGECFNCKIKYNGKNACIFDFHHINPKDKVSLLGMNVLMNRAWDFILKEAEKCIILCTICHRIHHSEEY